MKYTREQARSAAADDAYKCTIELAATADEPSYLDWTTGVYSETSYLDGGDVGSISGGPPTCVQADNDAGRASDTAGDNNGPIPLSMTMPLDLTRHSVNYDAYCLTGPLQYPSGSVHLELPEGPADVGYQLTTYDGVLGYLSLHGWTGTEEIDGFGFVELDFREKTTSGCTEEFPKTLTMRGSLAVLSTEFGESHSLELPPLCPQSGIGAQCVSAPPTDPCPGGELRVGWSCVEMPDANAPSSESPPRVFGKPRDGRTLTASSGTWAGSEPVTHAYQWQRRDPDTYEWTDIPNALTSTYTPTAEDVWLPFRVLVTADNRAGSATAGSDETEYVEPAPPASTAPPAIVGVAQKGETLSATKGEWKGTLTDAEYSYQWQYCYYVDSGPCYDIDGATSERYTVEHSGAPLRVRVRIAAWAGEAAATSARTPEALPGRDCPEDEMGVGPACVFTPIAPDPAGPLAPGKSESVPPVAQPDRSQLPIFDTMTPGGGYLMPYGQAPNTTNPKMFQLYVSHVAVAAGGGRVYVAYRDGGQSGIYSGVQMFDARTLEYLGKFGEHAYGGWGVGIAYYEDEVFVADHEDAEIEVYDPTGQHLRSFPTSVAGNPPEDCSGSPHGRKVPEGDTCLLPWGLDVAWGEVWVTLEAHSDCDEYTIQGYHAGADQPPPQCSLIGVYDAKTGALKALLPHAARYGCSRDPQDGAPAAADDCASIADPSRLECEDRWPTSPGYPACTEYRTLKYGYTDLAVAPGLDGVWAQCRLVHRGQLSAVSMGDVLTPDAVGDCPESRFLEGVDAVWGMDWLVTASGDPDNRRVPGRYITEYDARPSAGLAGQQQLTVARRWQPKDFDPADPVRRDVVYNARDTQVDWSGALTRSDWLNGNQCLNYIVTDADIYVIGWRGERWFELTRGFDRIDFAVDGQHQATRTTPSGQLCLSTNTFSSGTHELTATAHLSDGRAVVSTNPELKIDHTPPTGSVDSPGQFLSGPVTITGDMSDSHSGPGQWRLQHMRDGSTSWSDICTVGNSGPYTCDWDTSQVADGSYTLRAELSDVVERSGPNIDHAEATVIVDNTRPDLNLSGELEARVDFAPIYDFERPDLEVQATDLVAGVKAVDVLVDGLRVGGASQPCGGGACEMSVEHTFEPQQHADGAHLVQVSATDQAGNGRVEEWSVDVEKIPNDADESEDAAEEKVYETYDTGLDGAGLQADMNVANGTAAAPELPFASYLACTEDPEATLGFEAYSLGSVFESLPQVAVLRRCQLPDPFGLETGRANFISYIYGDCDPPGGDGEQAGCPAPLEVQTWPVCERSLADYEDAPGVPAEFESLGVINGAPAAAFDDGERVELYTGESTVVIFGNEPTQILRAAENLIPTSAGDGDPVPLPEPIRGALDGTALCT